VCDRGIEARESDKPRGEVGTHEDVIFNDSFDKELLVLIEYQGKHTGARCNLIIRSPAARSRVC
jgi:hypothetical protein